jgi:RimJ/RimL family protein N-acetyltransferase
MVRENWDHLYEFLPEKVQAMQSKEDAGAFLRWLNGEWQQRNLFLFGLWEKATGRYVGETYLANPDWQVPSIELGYYLVQTATGQGYATEAARAVLRCAFDRLNVSRVDLQCRADNTASQRVAQRYGLLREEWEGESEK